MGNTNELDQLLGGQNGSGTPAGTPPASKPAADDVQNRIDEAVAKVTEGLGNRIKTLNDRYDTDMKVKDDEIARLATLTKPLEALQTQPTEPEKPDFDTNSMAGWNSHIDKRTGKATENAMSEIKKVQWDKAKSSFAKTHGYDLNKPEDMAKVENIIVVAKRLGVSTELDADVIVPVLNRAWAAENADTLADAAKQVERYKAQSQISSNELATSGGVYDPVRSSGSAEATSADWRAYREYQRAGGESSMENFLKMRAG